MKTNAMNEQKNLTQHEQDLQYIRDFRIIDDDFEKKVLADPKCTELVLRIIAEIPYLKVIKAELIKNLMDTMKCSLEQAMNALKIPENERSTFSALLK